jgi:hypothetical protein
MRLVLATLLLVGSIEAGAAETPEDVVSLMMFGYNRDISFTFDDDGSSPAVFHQQSSSPLTFFGAIDDLDGTGQHRARFVSSVTWKSNCEFSVYQASFYYLTLTNGGFFIKNYIVNADIDFRRTPDPIFPDSASKTIGAIDVTTTAKCQIAATDEDNRKHCSFTNVGPVDPVKAAWKHFRTDICKQ